MKKLLFAFLLAASASVFVAQAHGQAIVIANPSVKAADVSKGDLKDVFTGGASSLKDGSSVTPVLLKSGAVHDEFLSVSFLPTYTERTTRLSVPAGAAWSSPARPRCPSRWTQKRPSWNLCRTMPAPSAT